MCGAAMGRITEDVLRMGFPNASLFGRAIPGMRRTNEGCSTAQFGSEARTAVEFAHLAQRCVLAESMRVDSAVQADRLGTVTLAEFTEYVDRQLGCKLSLRAVARHAGLSRAAFTRKFRYSFQMSFHRYLMNRRVEAAKYLLRETDVALYLIAEKTGFSSQSHFAAVFRQSAGCPPGRFRAQSRLDQQRTERPFQHPERSLFGRRKSVDSNMIVSSGANMQPTEA